MNRQKYKRRTLISLATALVIVGVQNIGSLEHSKLLEYGFFLAVASTVVCTFLWALAPVEIIAQQDAKGALNYRPGSPIIKELKRATIINFIVLFLAGLNYQSTKDSDAWAGMTYVIVIPIVFVTGIFCLISVTKLIRNPILYGISRSKAWTYAILVTIPYILGYVIASV